VPNVEVVASVYIRNYEVVVRNAVDMNCVNIIYVKKDVLNVVDQVYVPIKNAKAVVSNVAVPNYATNTNETKIVVSNVTERMYVLIKGYSISVSNVRDV
jgi:hypothetical protein